MANALVNLGVPRVFSHSGYYFTDFDGAAGSVGDQWQGSGLLNGLSGLYLTPSEGADEVDNGNFATGDLTSWPLVGTPPTAEVLAGRAHIISNGSNQGIRQDIYANKSNKWLRFSFDYEVISGTMGVSLGGASTPYVTRSAMTGSGTPVDTCLEGFDTLRPWRFLNGLTSSAFFIDNASCKVLTNLFAYRKFARSYGKITVNYTRTARTQFGIAFCVVDSNNYGLIYDKSQTNEMIVGKFVAGVWTQIGAFAITYSPASNLELTVHRDGKLDFSYGAVTQTNLTSIGFASRYFGVFSTYPSNIAHSFEYDPHGVS